MHYLDHAATTPMRASAREAWLAAAGNEGNPSSLHTSGRRARAIVEDARESVAASLGAHPTEVIFTAGATEANNLAIAGSRVALIVTTPTEHHSALDPVRAIAGAGWTQVFELPVGSDSVVELDELPRALELAAGRPTLVSVHWVNNETGVVQPIAALVERVGELAAAAGAGSEVTIHSDAVQAVPYQPMNFGESGLTTLAVSAHKLGGPVGVGALLAKRGVNLEPQTRGGGQQRFRSGTLDAPGAAAFAVALAETVADRNTEVARLSALRDRLVAGLPALTPTAANAPRSPHIVHYVVPGASAEAMLAALDMRGIEVSSGSACTAGVVDASHVLLAMGRSEADAASTLRISLGRTTTPEDVDALVAALPNVVEQASSRAAVAPEVV